MAMKLREVRESALALPLRSRRKLADELRNSVVTEDQIDSLGKSTSSSARAAAEWKIEIKRRMDAYARGEARTVPGEKVMAWLRKRMT